MADQQRPPPRRAGLVDADADEVGRARCGALRDGRGLPRPRSRPALPARLLRVGAASGPCASSPWSPRPGSRPASAAIAGARTALPSLRVDAHGRPILATRSGPPCASHSWGPCLTRPPATSRSCCCARLRSASSASSAPTRCAACTNAIASSTARPTPPRRPSTPACPTSSPSSGQPDLPAERLDARPEAARHPQRGGQLLPERRLRGGLPRGINVVACAPVYAQAVAEHALGLAIDLARGISREDRAFREGRERYVSAGNAGRHPACAARRWASLATATSGAGCCRSWRPSARAASAATTRGCPTRSSATRAWSRRRSRRPWREHVPLHPGHRDRGVARTSWTRRTWRSSRRAHGSCSSSRAAVVDFDALIAPRRARVASCARPTSGPRSPLPPDHPGPPLEGMVLSAHRAGGIPSAFHEIGEMVLDDLDAHGAGPAAGAQPAGRARARGSLPLRPVGRPVAARGRPPEPARLPRARSSSARSVSPPSSCPRSRSPARRRCAACRCWRRGRRRRVAPTPSARATSMRRRDHLRAQPDALVVVGDDERELGVASAAQPDERATLAMTSLPSSASSRSATSAISRS